jgi:hypothetical protein
MKNKYTLNRFLLLAVFLVVAGNTSLAAENGKKLRAKSFLAMYTWPLEKVIAEKETWLGLEKQFDGIDSLDAWNFMWRNNVVDYANPEFFHKIKFVQKDLNQDAEDDVFVTLDEKTSVLYVQHKNDWKKIWSVLDDTGNPPTIEENEDTWLKYVTFDACSNCSRDYATYYKVLEDTVVPIASLYWGYNTTYEAPNKLPYLYDQCDAFWEFNHDTLIVHFFMKLMEEGSELCFLEQDLTIRYKMDASFQLEMISVAPEELKPAVQHWNNFFQDSYQDYGYSPNNEVMMACLDYHNTYLLSLKTHSKYRKMISKLETNYGKEWAELVSTAYREGSF